MFLFTIWRITEDRGYDRSKINLDRQYLSLFVYNRFLCFNLGLLIYIAIISVERVRQTICNDQNTILLASCSRAVMFFIYGKH